MANVTVLRYNGTDYDLGKPADNTLTQIGFPADAKITGERFGVVENDIKILGTFDYQYINQDTLVPDTAWSYSSNDGFYRNTASSGLTADPFHIKAGTYYVIGFNGYGSIFHGDDGTRKTFYQLFNIGQSSSVQELTFSQDGTVYYTGITSSSSTVRHLFSDAPLPDTDINGAYNIKYDNVYIADIAMAKENVIMPASVTWKKGSLDADGNPNTATTYRIYSDLISTPFSIEFGSGIKSTIYFYKQDTYVGKLNSNGGIDKVSGDWGLIGGKVNLIELINSFADYDIDGVRLTIRGISDPLDDEEAQEIGDESCYAYAFGGMLRNYFDNKYIKNQITGHEGEAVVMGFLHQTIDVVKISGSEYLRGGQSFCIYNDKYYSTDGSNIYIQDRNFTLESTTLLNVGHGNAFQVGHSNLGYVSGWDDSTIYVIDMDTVTLTSTITLPISGYFSAVVDDLNNLVYILYRTDRPSTIDYYTFAVYDLTTNQIIKSKKIFAFGALQDCDYLDGKIVFMYGIPAGDLPSGMCIINTSGDVIANIYDEKISDAEPEGCVFDTAYNRLLFCRAAYSVYSIEGVGV